MNLIFSMQFSIVKRNACSGDRSFTIDLYLIYIIFMAMGSIPIIREAKYIIANAQLA